MALFGTAVLNGIVAVAYFNQLKAEDMSNIKDRTKVGISVRLRPVILTAAVAYLGFLPVALSNSMGAEVQKPFTTMVIGGLITATLFTLIVLPILYYYAGQKFRVSVKSTVKTHSLLFVFGMMLCTVQAQNATITTVEQAIEVAMKNHPTIKSNILQINQQVHLLEAAYVLPKMDISAAYGQFNSTTYDQSFHVSQSFNPFLIKIKKSLAKGYVHKSELQLAMAESELKHHIKTLWDKVIYHTALMQLIKEKENLYEQFARFAEDAFANEEIGSLEKQETALQYQQIKMERKNASTESAFAISQLEAWVQQKVAIKPNSYTTQNWAADLQNANVSEHPAIKILLKEIEIVENEAKANKAEQKPEVTIAYQAHSFKGFLEVDNELVEFNRLPQFHGFELGISLPVFGKGYKALNKAKAIDTQIKKEEARRVQIDLETQLNILLKQFTNAKENEAFYTQTALPNAQQIKADVSQAYKSGDVSFSDYLNNLELYFETMDAYLEAVHTYNQIVFDVEYLMGE